MHTNLILAGKKIKQLAPCKQQADGTLEKDEMMKSRLCLTFLARASSRGSVSTFAFARALTLTIALTSALALSACERNQRSDISPPWPNASVGVKLRDGMKYDEPAVRGKIVDAVTKQPIQGVMIYGFYATSNGTLAGGKTFGEHVKSFEAETDANGVFTLPAWDTGDRAIKGEVTQSFPVIAIYKPGYDLWNDTMSSIRQWKPKSGIVGTEVEIKDGVRDWTKFPHQLFPITKEYDRYESLSSGSRMMGIVGECGWEVYAKTLLVRHAEAINMKRRLIPADRRNADDMPKDAYPLGVNNRTPEATAIENLLVTPVYLHKLRDTFRAAGASWKCSSPEKLLNDVESKLSKP